MQLSGGRPSEPGAFKWARLSIDLSAHLAASSGALIKFAAARQRKQCAERAGERTKAPEVRAARRSKRN